jgi:hypothetical protein
MGVAANCGVHHAAGSRFRSAICRRIPFSVGDLSLTAGEIVPAIPA